MSKTRKDSAKAAARYIEVVKRDDGAFDLLENRSLTFTKMSERTLADKLCITWGYCGKELDDILSEVQQTGRNRILL